MRDREEGLLFEGLDVFGAATACAVLAGALSLLAPFLFALTGTLVALALAGWAAGPLRTGGRARPSLDRSRALALAALAAAVVLAGLSHPPIAEFRGPILGAAGVPLWWAERHRPRPVEEFGGPT